MEIVWPPNSFPPPTKSFSERSIGMIGKILFERIQEITSQCGDGATTRLPADLSDQVREATSQMAHSEDLNISV